jgi:3-mercaptopyruvate sulfurtransferase SseA
LGQGEGKGLQLIDARSAPQYKGELSRGARSGHIPGAVNIPYKELLGTLAWRP